MQKYMIFSLLALFLGTNSFADARQAGSIVVDKKNAIYWQDDASSKESSEDWNDAILYCDKLVLNGMEHWRLPTFKELFSIVDYTRSHPAINPLFGFVAEGSYWTSTPFSPTKARAWTIDFRRGETYYNYTTTNHAVRCVKEISMGATKEVK